MKTIPMLNFTITRTRNIGDLMCPPLRWLGPNGSKSVRDMRDLEGDDTRDELEVTLRGGILILGGGGMLHNFWLRRLMPVLREPRPYRAVVWGAGHNNYAMSRTYPDWMGMCDLVGVRDYRTDHRWAPCVSCLCPDFDLLADTHAPHKYVLFEHVDHPIPFKRDGDDEIPFGRNTSFETLGGVLRFLALGQIVVTTSYHGAYWARLLGRRVVAYPWSSKFLEMRHGDDWPLERDWHSVRTGILPEDNHDALRESRAATMSFWRDMKALAGDRS